MDRRSFLKISAITSGSVALSQCAGGVEQELIRFIPEEELTPGVAVWKPSICPLCQAGCGVLVRVMDGEAEVVRNGQLGLIRMGLPKKLEGNPMHPVSQGKLCPRGQAAIQVTYHPDRLRQPLKRSGPRGAGQFQEIGWDEALSELVARLRDLVATGEQRSAAFLSRPLRGHRRELVARFLAAFGAPPPISFELLGDEVLRRANQRSFGRAQLPTFDLARSNFVISFGADFLGTWNSPVSQNVAYGAMRQGRPGIRAKFVQVEPRMSQTGANADEWVAIRPGMEGVLALGLAHVIIQEKLRPAAAARAGAEVIDGWSEGLPGYSPEDVEKRTGVTAARVVRLARELAEHGPAVALVGGAPLAHTNGLFHALAVNALNALLGTVGEPGGIFFTPSLPMPSDSAQSAAAAGTASVRELAERILSGQATPVKLLLLDEANPVFLTPPGWRVREALLEVPYIVSFGCFLDETSVLADLVLPDHSFLESWVDDVPESGATRAVASLAAPAMRPLHNTRALPDVLLEVARQLGGEITAALPFQTFEELLENAFERLRGVPGSMPPEGDDFWNNVQEQGGWWGAEGPTATQTGRVAAGEPVRFEEPQFDGEGSEYPFQFLPYASQAFLDGSLAHLPWLQEMPDVLSTAMWGTWVEINPGTAERLQIRQGDLIEVNSPHGKLRAPALLFPGIAPDMVAMPFGQGHEQFTRYASGRGANPVNLLAPVVEPATGALAWAATRVGITRVGEGQLALFAGGLREHPHENERR